MVTARRGPDGPRRARRPWTKRFSPTVLDAVFRDYDAGATGAMVCERNGISRATLYRWIAQYEKQPRAESSVTFLRARVAVLETCVVALTAKLAEREGAEAARIHTHRASSSAPYTGATHE